MSRYIGEQLVSEQLVDETVIKTHGLLSLLRKMKVSKNHISLDSMHHYGKAMVNYRIKKAKLKKPVTIFLLFGFITIVYHVMVKWKQFKQLFSSKHYG